MERKESLGVGQVGPHTAIVVMNVGVGCSTEQDSATTHREYKPRLRLDDDDDNDGDDDDDDIFISIALINNSSWRFTMDNMKLKKLLIREERKLQFHFK